MDSLSPKAVLEQVASALSVECRDRVIVIGSLAAGYCFFGEDRGAEVRTKDVDCMFVPYAKAVQTGKAVAERLFAENWELRRDAVWGEAGDVDTPDDRLPLVRLHPLDRTIGSLSSSVRRKRPRAPTDTRRHL